MADSIPKFCSKTGKPHSEYPPEYFFCPQCRAQLQGAFKSPVRKETHNEVITIDDSPIIPRAQLIPQVKKLRTAAEVARQQSIQKTSTSQLPFRTTPTSAKYPILLTAVHVQHEIFPNEVFGGKKFIGATTLRT